MRKCYVRLVRRSGAALFVMAAACSSSGGASDAPSAPASEICDPQNTAALKLRFDPPSMVLAPGTTRQARVVVDPDVCTKTTLAMSATGLVAPPASATLDHQAELAFDVTPTGAGRATIVATMHRDADGADARAELAIDVHAPAMPACAAASGTLSASTPSLASGGASVGTSAAAFTRQDELALPPLDVAIACDDTLAPGAIGPAVAFRGPPERMTKPLRRELDFTLPVDPALIPAKSRMRDLRVFYKGPRVRAPREVSVTGAHLVPNGDGWALAFHAPWLGTYQAAFDAEPSRPKRRLVHRALLGISMGAGGAATFGLRHHDMFDAIAMLGGPVDWTWLLWYVERYAMSGFCAKGATCAPTKPSAYPLDEPFAHTMDYEHLWNEAGGGTGGISRHDYLSMLTDVALARGNPNGQNADPALPFFAAGPKLGDPAVGDASCLVPLEPISGAGDEQAQRDARASCLATRCDPKNAWIAENGYYDDEFNPDGKERVISFCDGSDLPGASPYQASWTPPRAGEAMPAPFALAVDLNKNGVRDAGEPIIRAGHEPYDDVGTDGLPDAMEPGFDAAQNPDPNGDDYDPMINPTGTEGDHRFEAGEPFRDVGLDGVAGTASSPYDVGEGDGAYTEARGLSSWYAVDPHALVRSVAKDAHGALPSDDDLGRVRIWTDGGVRDFLGFARDADHLHGALATRTTRPRGATFFGGFDDLPGETRGDIGAFDATRMLFRDLPEVVGVRYGDVDATAQMIADGDGQHVGSGKQVMARLAAAYRFVGASWPDADRTLTETSSANPADSTTDALGIGCEVGGSCSTVFTGPKSGRSAPVTVVVPPGYAHAANAQKRYPVVYVMHGYGQQASDVTALAVLTLASMNDSSVSYVDRLPKFIVVYVDGRCRLQASGRADCVAGSFYLDSERDGGARVETWTEELVAWVDASFRTMPPSEVDDPW